MKEYYKLSRATCSWKILATIPTHK